MGVIRNISFENFVELDRQQRYQAAAKARKTYYEAVVTATERKLRMKAPSEQIFAEGALKENPNLLH
ncbi:hypothetical protein [Labrys okinawensis]|uniref:hypothetical protein n=1 Tax=Labrys okinawensis TaxID=346911 RepID=UPI0011B22BAA|nr:hypothetical protein [Labrys okinawensis]